MTRAGCVTALNNNTVQQFQLAREIDYAQVYFCSFILSKNGEFLLNIPVKAPAAETHHFYTIDIAGFDSRDNRLSS